MNPNLLLQFKGLFSISFFFINIYSLERIAAAANPKIGDCEPKSCGSIDNISYPFWIEGQQPDYCGYPGFNVNCSDGIPYLQVPYGDCRILDIFYNNESIWLSVSEANLLDHVCSNSFFIGDSPFAGSSFKISAVNKKLLIRNCSREQDGSFRLPCDPRNIYVAYIGDDYFKPDPPISGDCQTTKLPVSGYAGAESRDYEKLLGYGYLLDWDAPNCTACRASKGQCGYDRSNNSFMCICPDRRHRTRCFSSKSSKKRIIIGSAAVTGGLLLACLLSFLYLYQHEKLPNSIFFWRRKSDNSQHIKAFLERYGSLAPKKYRYKDVKRITRKFHEKLGQGGYGTVFKGSLMDGRLVAVKILSDSKGDGEEFINEVASIGRTSHVNIVSLLGFSSEGSKRALIYEYMPNGSLDKYIYSEKSILGLEILYQIAIGVAQGLEYLHRGCNTRIVHFDIKPHNILLDQEFCPKISDFGLAKLCPPKISILSMADPRGTIGFIAPEVFSRNFGVVSSKSDVYSYGMMVLEMVGGRKNLDVGAGKTSEIYFPHWIYKHIERDGNLQAYGVTAETEEIARKMILVGLWCIQTQPESRPSMSKVVDMLQGSLSDLQVPPDPVLSSPQGSLIDSSAETTH
ncbi:LEAF RUST 10 DISEASE-RESISTANCEUS RECEPTOR-LIKE PROTEIN KINASE-like 2.7 isoform X2 [Elaeis guineensis]|uniref:LEAF RUST 10 DISEASE-RESISTANCEUS RECEPTOR-LIKE PROTEIN KINASE-like 2.7 isoform X2 n=1 Tax=Elaeis guineensis var. tenera TaxID=51953 RepID=UPI003C6D5AA6